MLKSCRSGLTDEAVGLLSLSTSLTDLSLSSNQITDAGARALSVFPALVRLDLHAQTGTAGLTDASAEALSRNTSLTALDLSENKLSPYSVSFFTSNTALTTLKLYRSLFPFFPSSHSPSTMEQQIGRNKVNMLQRRKTLLQFLFTVARQKRKGEGPFARVPVGMSLLSPPSMRWPASRFVWCDMNVAFSCRSCHFNIVNHSSDIIVHTMRFFPYKEFGKSTLQLQSICYFIFSKVDWMNRHLETKRSLRIQERPSSASLPDNAPSKLQLMSLYLDG